MITIPLKYEGMGLWGSGLLIEVVSSESDSEVIVTHASTVIWKIIKLAIIKNNYCSLNHLMWTVVGIRERIK